MTLAYHTDHAAFEAAIISWLERCAFLPGGSVRFGKQIGDRPNLPYGTIQPISGGGVVGHDAEYHEYNSSTERLDVMMHGPRSMTVQVEIYTAPSAEIVNVNTSAKNKLNSAIAGLRAPSILKLFNDAGLAFLQVLSSPREADEQLGQRWERRMQADLEFGYTSLFSDVSDPEGDGGTGYISTADPIVVSFLE